MSEATASNPKAAQRIQSAAKDLFYRQGIRATGVEEVCRVAEATKMSLYRTYPSKDALIAAILQEDAAEWDAWFAEVTADAPTADRTAISRMRASPRTSSRFATLAQAMSSRQPTAPANTQRAGRMPPRISSSRPVAKAENRIASGYRPCAVMACVSDCSSADAVAADCPGASTPAA